MTRLEHLLTILSEECMETGQRISKAARFSLNEIQAGHSLNNAKRINYEFNDILAVMELIKAETGYDLAVRDEESIATKKLNVEKYINYSKECGTLEDEDMREKARRFDKLSNAVGDLYKKLDDEGDDYGLGKIGELTASHLGFI